MRWLRARALATLATAASLLRATPAFATAPLEDPYELPDAPRSMTLPELTHPDIEWTLVTSAGGVSHGGHTSPETAERYAVEAPLGLRRYFAGLAYETADGVPIAGRGGTMIVGGNLELYGRTVWATRTGLAFGAGLGLLPPVAAFTPDSPGGGGDVAVAAASLVPWDYAYYRVGYFTMRPFVDVRDIFGRFVVQFRFSFDTSLPTRGQGDPDAAAASTLYLGIRASSLIGVGIEANEYYLISADVPEDRRAKLSAAMTLRFLTPGIQPAIGAFTSIGPPLAYAADSAWGLRFALTFVWDPRRPFWRALVF